MNTNNNILYFLLCKLTKLNIFLVVPPGFAPRPKGLEPPVLLLHHRTIDNNIIPEIPIFVESSERLQIRLLRALNFGCVFYWVDA